jgi:hypothetical protein
VRGSAPGDTQPSLGTHPTPVSGVRNLGDQTKNAGGHGHSMPVVLRSQGFAYKVVVLLGGNILVPLVDITRLSVLDLPLKYELPKTEAWSSPSSPIHLIAFMCKRFHSRSTISHGLCQVDRVTLLWGQDWYICHRFVHTSSSST